MRSRRLSFSLDKFISTALSLFPPFSYTRDDASQSSRVFDHTALHTIRDDYFAAGESKAEELKAINLPNVNFRPHYWPTEPQSLPKEKIPTLVEAISETRKIKNELEKIHEQNPELYSQLVKSAQLHQLLIDENDKIILCRVNIDPKNETIKYDDYFLLEESLGTLAYHKPKALYLAEHNKFELDSDYHKNFTDWHEEIKVIINLPQEIREKAWEQLQKRKLLLSAASASNSAYTLFAVEINSKITSTDSAEEKIIPTTNSPSLSCRPSIEEVD